MCGIAEIRETFTESKIGNRKNTKLGTVIQENEKQIHYTQTAIGLFFFFFFFFFPHLIFLRSGSAFIILLPVYEQSPCLGSRLYSLRHHNGIQVDSCAYLLPFPPTSPIYKNAIVIYNVREKKQSGINHDSSHWVLAIEI